MAIYIVMADNAHDKLCQLKVNNMNCHVYCNIRFGTNIGTQFSIPSIIIKMLVLPNINQILDTKWWCIIWHGVCHLKLYDINFRSLLFRVYYCQVRC